MATEDVAKSKVLNMFCKTMMLFCRYVSMAGELFLAPEAGHKHIYRSTDHIVVLAKE